MARRRKRSRKRASYFSPARRAGRRRARARRRKRGGIGLAGKAGVAVIVGAPLVGTAIETAAQVEGVARAMASDPPTALGLARIGFWQGLNNLSMGFGGGNLTLSVPIFTSGGVVKNVQVGSTVPMGAWWKTAIPGSFLLAADILYSWGVRLATGVKSGVRILGKKITSGR